MRKQSLLEFAHKVRTATSMTKGAGHITSHMTPHMHFANFIELLPVATPSIAPCGICYSVCYSALLGLELV